MTPILLGPRRRRTRGGHRIADEMTVIQGRDLREVNERRSIALHRVVGERLRDRPELIAAARQRIDDWIERGSIHPAYGEAWRQLLAGPLETLLASLVDPNEQARTLRQCSPFAGVLDPRTRWRIWRGEGL